MSEYSFQEVMRQFKRMCEHADSGCSGCAFQGSDCSMSALVNNIEEAESLIMQWAADHPEPVFPTWAEWLEQQGLLEKRDVQITEYGHDSIGIRSINAKILRDAADKPIPAEFAQLIGLTPKGEPQRGET